jgi:hypothetical protein
VDHRAPRVAADGAEKLSEVDRAAHFAAR